MDTKAQKGFSRGDVLVFFLKNHSLLLVLVFNTLPTTFTNTFLMQNDLMSLVRQISANAITGVGYILLLASDSVDLSARCMTCMIGIISGPLSQAGLPLPAILILCTLVGVACGAWNAMIENKFELPPLLVTLVMQRVFRGYLMLLSNGPPVGDSNKGTLLMGRGCIGLIPTPVVLMLSFIAMGVLIFSRTQSGRNVVTVGGGPEAVRVLGIGVSGIGVLVDMVLGATAAVTILVSCGRVVSAQTTLGGDTVVDTIVVAVIGGAPMGDGSGTVVGIFFGCLITGLISNGLNLLEVSSYWQMVSKGVIILVAIILDMYSEKIYERMRGKE